jgi:hypothetical protein
MQGSIAKNEGTSTSGEKECSWAPLISGDKGPVWHLLLVKKIAYLKKVLKSGLYLLSAFSLF